MALGPLRRSSIKRYNANLTVRSTETMTYPQQVQSFHAATHAQVVGDLVARGKFPQDHITITDGKLNKPFFTVKPGGKTIARAPEEDLSDIVLWILARLTKYAPVDTGKYRYSFRFEESRNARGEEVFEIYNTAPYAWVIERVPHEKWLRLTPAAFKLMYKTTKKAIGKFKGNAWIDFRMRGFNGQPTIVVRGSPYSGAAGVRVLQ